LLILGVVPIRDFTDAAGVRWTVWNTVPFTTGVMTSMQAGWLTFESSEGRRRLSPVPDGWERVSVDRLCTFCADAKPVGRTSNTGSRPVERDRP
jgi:hypothetical protein